MGDSVRAEVVGSLLRPAALVELRKQHDAGELDASHFKHEEDQHVEAAIRMQEDAGIDVITDGEQRRYAFFGHLVESFDGFDKEGGWAIPFRDEKGEELIFKRPVVVGKLRWRHSMCAEDWTFLRAKARRPGKVTMISAQQAAAYY
ncbi:MAG: methionine synthase, partial [Chloroflexi bacterium]